VAGYKRATRHRNCHSRGMQSERSRHSQPAGLASLAGAKMAAHWRVAHAKTQLGEPVCRLYKDQNPVQWVEHFRWLIKAVLKSGFRSIKPLRVLLLLPPGWDACPS